MEKLERRLEQLDARIKQAEGRERARERKQDTRREVLLGALLPDWMEWFLTRKMDRELFGLSPEAKVENEASTPLLPDDFGLGPDARLWIFDGVGKPLR